MAPRIAVLLATYNGSAWVVEQINSILSQEGVDVDVIIRDDASTDDTAGVIAREFLGNVRVRLSTALTGSGSAGGNFRNLIVDLDVAGYDFIAFADQDDIWLPSKLAEAVKCLDSSGAEAYSSAVTAVWPDGRRRHIAQNGSVRAFDFLFEGAGQGCTFVMKPGLIAEAGAFIRANEALVSGLYYHDWLIYILARVRGSKWFFDGRSYILYRQHQANDTGARGGLAAAAFRVQKIRSGWYAGQISVACEVYRRASGGGEGLLPLVYGRDLAAGRFGRLLFLLRYGRRRLSDRLVLAVSALLGWL